MDAEQSTCFVCLGDIESWNAVKCVVCRRQRVCIDCLAQGLGAVRCVCLPAFDRELSWEAASFLAAVRRRLTMPVNTTVEWLVETCPWEREHTLEVLKAFLDFADLKGGSNPVDLIPSPDVATLWRIFYGNAYRFRLWRIQHRQDALNSFHGNLIGRPVDDQEAPIFSSNTRYVDTFMAMELFGPPLNPAIWPLSQLPTLSVTVKSLSGITSRITNVYPHFKVAQLKILVQRATGIPPDLQGLVLAGQRLQDAQVIQELGLRDDSIIMLVLKMRGD